VPRPTALVDSSAPRLAEARFATARRWALLAALAFGASVPGCSCGKNDAPPPPQEIPVNEGRATAQELLTTLGPAKGLESTAASTSIKWARVVGDGDRVLLGGAIANEAVAIISDNAARNWKSLKAPAPDLAAWSVGADGTVVLALTRRAKPKVAPKKGELPPIDSLSVLFAAPGGDLETKIPLIEPPSVAAKGPAPPAGPVVPLGDAIAAVVSADAASFVIETAPRKLEIVFVPKTGTTLPPAIPIPAGERPVFAPYGRPPVLLTIGPRGVLRRPWPKPGEPLAKPDAIPNTTSSATIQAELSAGPECEVGSFSYRRVTAAGNKVFILGIAPDKSVYFEVPASTIPTSPIGCGGGRVVVEALDPRDSKAKLVACAENGCVAPENVPFRPWNEKHDRVLGVASTSKAVVAMAGHYSPLRWGLYEGQSSDGGKLWDPQRTMGEGPGERGRYELGAVLPAGDRILALLAADVTGTNRRSWFAIASTDGGVTWGVP
jgi:hypothetical protein